MGGFLHAPSKERVILSEVRKHGVEESSHYRQCCADILCEDPSIPHLRCYTQDDRCGGNRRGGVLPPERRGTRPLRQD